MFKILPKPELIQQTTHAKPQLIKKFFTTFPSSLTQKKQKRNTMSSYNQNGRWTKEEHNKFIEAIVLFGSDWKKVQKHVSSRSSTQARSHAQKFLMKLRQSEMIKKRKINLNLSWAKSIQIIKKEFTVPELNKLLHSVTCKRKSFIKNSLSKKNKSLNNNDDINSDNSNNTFNDDFISVISNSTEINSVDFYDIEQQEQDKMLDLDEEMKENSFRFKNKYECIKSFMENFSMKKINLDYNDDYLYSWKSNEILVDDS
jgi:SHAQKYF class myb-like DNA-binding protein